MNSSMLKLMIMFKTICFLLLIFIIVSMIAAFLKLSGGQQQLLWLYFILFVGWFGFTGYYGAIYPCSQVSKKQGGSSNIVDCIFSLKPPQSAKFDRDLFSYTTFGNKFLSDFIIDVIGLPMLFVFGGYLITVTPIWKILQSPEKNLKGELLSIIYKKDKS